MKKKSITLQEALKAVADEPEFPYDPNCPTVPDDIWEAVRNNKDVFVEAMRLSVRMTKEAISERIKNLAK